MNFMTASFWIEKSTDKVSTIDVCARKLTKLHRKLIAKFQMLLAYVVQRFIN